MKKTFAIAWLLGACTHAAPPGVTPRADSPTTAANVVSTSWAYPPSRRVDVKDVYHGIEVPDPYRWLEDGTSPEVQAWAHAQDDFARSRLATSPVRSEFLTRLKDVLYAGKQGTPARFGERYIYERRDKGRDKRAIYMRAVAGGAERMLIDPARWPEEQSLTLQDYWPSSDGRKIAYAVSKNGADLAVMRVLDVDTGADIALDTIDPVIFPDVSWSADNKGFYYRQYPSEPGFPSNELIGRTVIRYHRLGSNPQQDATARPATGDSRVYEMVTASRDGRWLLLSVEKSNSRIDWYFRKIQDAQHPGPWTPLVVEHEFRHEVIAHGGAFYVKSNDGAPNGRILRVDPARPARENWREIVPGRADAALDTFLVAGGKLLVRWHKDASHELEIRELDGSGARVVALPALGEVTLTGRPRDDDAFVGFQNYGTLNTVYSLSMKTGAMRAWAGVDAPRLRGDVAIERVFSVSKDGTRVPVFVVHRRDVPLDGRAPLFMTAYGGFAIPISPTFFPSVYAWIEQGGVFADVAARGGAEYGEPWHHAGMLTNKQHTFDDVIGAAEDLVRRGWARPERLSLCGSSNGGLTTATVIVQRPDLFRAAVSSVPVIDVIRSPLFGNGKSWETEYGTPADADQFRAMFAYSPYHHIKAGTNYPALLLRSADSDDRVDPMHARKFAAAMQAVGGPHPVLFQVRRHAGHFGTDAVQTTAEGEADAMAFLWAETTGALNAK